MRPRRVFSIVAAAGLLVTLAASPVAAGTGCPTWGNPGTNSGMRNGQLMAIDDAVARTMVQLTDAWFAAVGTTREQTLADRTALAEAEDKNGDEVICVAEINGTELNPKSHWATFWGDLLDPREASVFFIFDNHMGTSNN